MSKQLVHRLIAGARLFRKHSRAYRPSPQVDACQLHQGFAVNEMGGGMINLRDRN
jgi:hypothetical protein